MDVAVIAMPWADPAQTSIQLGVLKAALRDRGIGCRAIHAYRQFAALVGKPFYTTLIAESALGFLAEWLFAYSAFGLDNGDEYFAYLEKRVAPSLSGTAPAAAVLADTLGPNYRQTMDHVRRTVVPEFITDQVTKLTSTGPCDVVGFTCVFNQLVPSLAFARALKAQHSDVRTVFGGSAVQEAMGRECLRSFPWVDYVVEGEGEVTFPELVQYVRAGRSESAKPPLGVRYRNGSQVTFTGPREPIVNLDDTPVPDYDDYFFATGETEAQPSTTVIRFETSRGCWWGEKSHCTFCAVNGTSLTYREKSAERILREMASLAARYRSRRLYATDSIAGKAFLEGVLPELTVMDCDLELFFEVRPTLAKSRLQMMHQAGLQTIQPGIESFSTDILKLMKKGIRGIHNVQFLKWCREIGLQAVYYILWGFPGEPPAAYARMAALLPKLFHLEPPDHPPRLINYERFSPLFCQSQALQLQPRPDYHYIFPEGTDHRELAYSFEHPHEEEMRASAYIDAVSEQVRAWRERYFSDRRPIFVYARGTGFVEIRDSRCGVLERYVLTGDAASIFVYCDALRSRKQIQLHLAAERGEEYPDDELDGSLGELVTAGLLMQEGNSYLTLGIRQRALDRELRYASDVAGGR